MIVAQNLLHGAHIHAILQHQRGGGVAQLVGGIFRRVDAGSAQALFHHGVHHGAADPLVAGRQKQRIGVLTGDGPPNRQVILQRILAGIVQIQDAHLVAFAQDPQHLTVDIRKIQPHKLRDTQSAVEEQRQNAVVTFLIFAFGPKSDISAVFSSISENPDL